MRWPLAAFVCGVLGLTAGAAGRWYLGSPGAASAGGTDAPQVRDALPGAGASDDTGKKPESWPFPAVVEPGPRLSPEELLRLPDPEFMDRLARWLPEATVDELAKLVASPNDPLRRIQTLAAVTLRWAELDPAGAVRFATVQGNPTLAWLAWGRLAPEAALAAAAKAPHSPALASVLTGIAERDPEKARALGEKYPAAFFSSDVQSMLADRLQHRDPRAAADVAYKAGSGGAAQIVSRWARSDPQAALDWARSVPDYDARANLMGTVLSEWAHSQPEKIAAALEALPPGITRSSLMMQEVRRLAQADPQAALDYATGAKGVNRTSLVDAALERVAADDPARALATLGQLEPGDWAKPFALGATLRSLGQAAGAATMDWLNGPQGAVASSANPKTQQIVFSAWVEKSPEAASEWLAGQPTETRSVECIDEAAKSLARGPHRDFDAARQWASALPDDERRTARLTDVFSKWAEADPEAAAKALEGTPLPDGPRETLRQKIQRRKESR